MSLVFSIEEFATFDGPGIRMTVFLKGCPLSCMWCHNPEGQSPDVEFARSPNGCLRCGACERAARKVGGGIALGRESEAACPRGLVRRVGKSYSPDELAAKIMANAAILAANGGGATFSGGEPLYDSEYLFSVMRRLKGKVHLAIQTSGFASEEVFGEALRLTDYVLMDLKLVSDDEHRRYCGVGNAPILRNYRTLAASGVPFVTRIPLIPGVTDTEENLGGIAAFLTDCGVKYVETLPYNKFAGSKYDSLLRRYAPDFDEKREPRDGADIFARYGIETKKM